jgi:hypothetical protein
MSSITAPYWLHCLTGESKEAIVEMEDTSVLALENVGDIVASDWASVKDSEPS